MSVLASEQTPLLAGASASDASNELIDKSAPRIYKQQRRCFHITVTLGIICLILIGVAATVYFLYLNKSGNSEPVSSAVEDDKGLQALLNNSWPLPDALETSLSGTPFISLIQQAVDVGKEKLEEKQLSDVESVETDSPSFKHQHSIAETDDGNKQAEYGFIENEASKYLREKGLVGVIDYNLTTALRWTNESGCYLVEEAVTCNSSRYRTEDGFCNNVMNPRWGVAMTPYRRALPANYSDGVSAPRGGFNSTLPTARDVSTRVHRPIYRQDSKFTVMLAVWGQFVDHDMTATALSRGPNGETIACCRSADTDPDCYPVFLSEQDEYYSKHNMTCMEFVRSAAALRCSFGPREQLNQMSSFLDGSMIYGNTEHLSAELRAYEGGLLAMSYTKEGTALLPYSKNATDGCNQEEQIKKGRYCFLSGDSRANENTHLTSMHLIFARQHNKIAKQLGELNPDWDDETIYQEAKRIVGAQVQHITYNEFLPSILGEDMMNKLNLYSKNDSFSTAYNASINPSISNNFASSSFRFAHTLIPRMMKTLANDTSSAEYVEMHKMLFNPFGLYDGKLDSIVRGALETPIEKADNYFTDELTEHLFEATDYKNNKSDMSAQASENGTSDSHSYGLDLVALNIQRGRDHGLPTYPQWRKYCNLSEVDSFEDLEPIFDEESLKIIKEIYKSVDDVDLYTGSLSEKPISGGLLGPTLTCLIGDQFYRLKFGDRYWYETNEKPQAFTPEQLNEIKKTSLAGIICANADNLTNITPEVMRSIGENNEQIPCSEIEQPDLSYWKESENSSAKATSHSSPNHSKSPASHANKNPWNWRRHANVKSNDYMMDNSSGLSNEVWNEYQLENGTYSGEPTLPTWASDWAKNHSSRLVSKAISEVNGLTSHFPTNSSSASSFLELPEDGPCNFTIQTRKLEIFSKDLDTRSIMPNTLIPVKSFELNLIVWSPNASDSLNMGYKILGEAGSITLDSQDWPNETCLTPRKDCVYYSKVILGDLVDEPNVFEVSEMHTADLCSVIAPIALQGHYADLDTFYWTGGLTIYASDQPATLDKEEEMSLHTSHDSVSFPKIDGTLTLRERALWNGTLPVVFDTSTLSWYSTDDTAVYPVTWSGFYDESSFEGVFLLPHKYNDSAIRWHDGSFSLNLPALLPDEFKKLIRTNRVYSAVVYLTSNPTGIDRFDVSVFNKLRDWVFTDYSKIVLTGKFEEDGRFTWAGDITMQMGRLAVELPSTTYRPYGKYLFKIQQAELFAQLMGTAPVEKWWAGELTPTVVLPAGTYDDKLYANILNGFVVWSYDNDTVTNGNGTFNSFIPNSAIKLWGDFEFKFAFLMEDIWTTRLIPNVTYFSPIVLQYERMTFDFGDDMPERLASMQRPDLGVFAPITLLGTHRNNAFEWNGECLVTVVDV